MLHCAPTLSTISTLSPQLVIRESRKPLSYLNVTISGMVYDQTSSNTSKLAPNVNKQNSILPNPWAFYNLFRLLRHLGKRSPPTLLSSFRNLPITTQFLWSWIVSPNEPILFRL